MTDVLAEIKSAAWPRHGVGEKASGIKKAIWRDGSKLDLVCFTKSVWYFNTLNGHVAHTFLGNAQLAGCRVG